MIKRDDMSKLAVDKTVDAINAGDKNEAVKGIKQLWEEDRMVINLISDLVSSLLTFTAKKFGEENVIEAWQHVADDIWKPFIEACKDMEHEEVVDAFASLHRSLGSEFYIEQDDEKSTLYVTSCGSGGRMMKEGKYDNTDRHPMNGGTTKKAYPWSFNKVGISYYCIHSFIWYDSMPKELEFDMFDWEFGRQFDDDGNSVNEPCKLTIYRNPKRKN